MTRKSFWCLLFVGFVLTAGVAAQTRVIAEAELDKVISAATEKRKTIPHRATKVLFSSVGISTVLMTEFNGNDRYRHIGSTRVDGVVMSRTENIRIGSVLYILEDGRWSKGPLPRATGSPGVGNGGGTTSPTEREEKRDCLYLGNEELNGRYADHYQHVLTVTFAGPKPLTKKTSHDYWITSDGMMVKETSESIVRGERITMQTIEYEYPQEIKIVAPIPD